MTEKTIRVRVAATWEVGSYRTACIEPLEQVGLAIAAMASVGDEIDVTIRKVEKPKLRVWKFTETGEVRTPRWEPTWLVLGNRPYYCEGPMTSENKKYPILRLVESEVDGE